MEIRNLWLRANIMLWYSKLDEILKEKTHQENNEIQSNFVTLSFGRATNRNTTET